MELETELQSLRPRLLRQSMRAVRDPGIAEDLVQDALLAIVQQREQWRGQAALTTWAISILRHKIADWYRSARARPLVSLEDQPEVEQPGEDTASDLYDEHGAYRDAVPAWQEPENKLEQQQMMNVLQHCVDSLPRQAGRVFMMREWLGFENREICQRTGITAENCRMILHRARLSLRTCMQRDWLDGGRHA